MAIKGGNKTKKTAQKVITNNVFLISSFEHLFSAIGILIEEKNSVSSNPKAFARLGDLDIKTGNLGSEQRPHMGLPKKTSINDFCSESEAKLSIFFKKQNEIKDIRIVDNSFGIVSEDEKIPFNPNQETSEEKVYSASGKSSSKEIYRLGTTPNMYPWHFLQSSGYRALYYFLNKKRFAYRHQNQDVGKTIDEFSRTHKQVFFDQNKIAQIVLNSDFLLRIYDDMTNSKLPTKYQYLYATIRNGTGKEIEDDMGRENVKTISYICDYTTSLTSHPYVSTLHRTMLDTYNTFTMTHTSSNNVKNYEMALFAIMVNGSTVSRAIIDNLKFPSDKRYISLNMENNQFIEDEAIEYTLNRRDSSPTSVDANPEGFRKALSRSMPVMFGIFDVDVSANLYKIGSNYANSREERERLKKMLNGFAGFPGFCIVKKSGLFGSKATTSAHAMACDGIFVKKAITNDYLALPFFFLRYIADRGYCDQILIDKIIVCTHRDNVAISELSNGVVWGLNCPILATTFYYGNFFVTPFLSLCEKMAKVINTDIIYQEVLEHFGSSPLKNQIEIVMNNNTGEGILFSSNDTDTIASEVREKILSLDKKKITGTEARKYICEEYYKFLELKDPKSKNDALHFFPKAQSELKNSISESLACEKINLLTDAVDAALTEWYNKYKNEIDDEDGRVKCKGIKDC